MIPFFLMIKDKAKLRILNSVLSKISYFPLSLAISVPFLIVNVVLIPLAYSKTLLHKFILMFRMKPNIKRVAAFIGYLIFGILMLILS